jgi:hypothetical protein
LETTGPLDLNIQTVPDRFTHLLGQVRSLGDSIAWVTGEDLYRFVPGEAQPELVFSAPPSSLIPDFVGSRAGYAIITQETGNDNLPYRWRLWFLRDAASEPILVDQFDNDQMPLPTLAMDDQRIAWTRTQGDGDNVSSELRVVAIDALDKAQTLSTSDFANVNVDDPALHDDELWYGVRINDWDAGTESPHVEMRDLAHLDAPPTVYGSDVRAFMPAVNDQVVVWKGGGADEDSADNWGSVYVSWRTDGSIERVPDAGAGLDRLLYPSVGNRFVAWWDGRSQVFVYDLKARAVRQIVGYDRSGTAVSSSIAGNLLTFTTSHNGQNLQLAWALLPS